MRVGLILTTYNRIEYLVQTLNSISQIDYKDLVVVIVDDNSNEATKKILNDFSLPNISITRIYKNENKGIKDSLRLGFEYAFSFCEYAMNLDADAIVKPNIIQELLKLKKEYPNNIVSGFNSKNKNNDGTLRNPIIEEKETYYTKKYCNGINMLMSKSNYNSIVSKTLGVDGNWDFNTHNYTDRFIISKPSLVEHIGLNSSMGHTDNPDIAYDYNVKELQLENVTLFGVDAHNPSGLLKASEISQKNIQFGEVKIITERLFHGREGYSEFCIKKMAEYINTSHALIIHPDGFVQNYKAWNNDWLQYDYIGALWDWYNIHQNGNGGFSLRSKKLLDILSKLNLTTYHPEDDIICRKLRPMLEHEHGIKFAPNEVCKLFSIEGYGLKPEFCKYNGEFGFHGFMVKGLPIEIPTISKKTTLVSSVKPKKSISGKRIIKR